MNLFLAEHIDGNRGYLGTDESHHAARVMRLAEGAEILVTLGEGKIYRGVISEITSKKASFEVTGLYAEDMQQRKLSIAIAPTKSNDRFETFLEKATEIGVHRIIPLICRNSERRIYKTERGRKVIQAAAKQSLSASWPKLEEPVSFDQFINSESFGKQSYIAYCGDMERVIANEILPNVDEALVMIGPEGDFTAEEIDLALSRGLQAASLGSKRLRTETAGLVVAVAFNLQY